MKKCSICRKPFANPLFKCWVLRENWNIGAKPPYKFISGYKTLVLCLSCKQTPTTLSEELYEASPYLRDWDNTYFLPKVLMSWEEEKALKREWRVNED